MNLPVVGAPKRNTCYSFRNSDSYDRLKIFVTRCHCVRGGLFCQNFQSKLKFDNIYIYSLKLTELCINKDFAYVKTHYLVWNPNELACCGTPKEVPVAPSGSLTQMTELRYLSPNVSVSMGGGGAFLPTFQESLFLVWNYTMETNFVPNVWKNVLSVTQLTRYRHINIIS